MSEYKNNNWFKENAMGMVPIIISILTFTYFGIIQGNNNTNRIKTLETDREKIEIQIQALEMKKVDKEIFYMIQTSMAGIQVDIREIRINQLKKSIE